MSGWYGLIELVLVFGIVLGWGFWELHKMRSFKRKDPPPEA